MNVVYSTSVQQSETVGGGDKACAVTVVTLLQFKLICKKATLQSLLA